MGKKFNFFKDVYDPLATRLKPVAKAIMPALTARAVQGIQQFKKGGVVKGKKGKAVPVIAHGGEHVVTAAQKKYILRALGGMPKPYKAPRKPRAKKGGAQEVI